MRSMILTSYSCDGTMRWARLFEGAGDPSTGGLAYDGGGNIKSSVRWRLGSLTERARR